MRILLFSMAAIFLILSCERGRVSDQISTAGTLISAAPESDATSEPEVDEPQASLGEPEAWVSVANERSVEITWWDLLSEEERNYWEGESKKYDADPTYRPSGRPPKLDVNPIIDNAQIRIAGYVVGVDTDPDDFSKSSTFLFVPYQRACIHVPPPPINQTILAEASEPARTDPFVAYWLTGRIRIQLGENDLAAYTYVVDEAVLNEYEWAEEAG